MALEQEFFALRGRSLDRLWTFDRCGGGFRLSGEKDVEKPTIIRRFGSLNCLRLVICLVTRLVLCSCLETVRQICEARPASNTCHSTRKHKIPRKGGIIFEPTVSQNSTVSVPETIFSCVMQCVRTSSTRPSDLRSVSDKIEE